MNISQKGLAGEYYVLAQLTARGINASLTLGNTKGVDILVYNEEKKKGYKVEVKTSGNKPNNVSENFKKWFSGPNIAWILNSKCETNISDDLIYCFVHLTELDKLPRFFLVPSKDVAKQAYEVHNHWLNLPRNKPVKDSAMRKFGIDLTDPNGYENNWDILNS